MAVARAEAPRDLEGGGKPHRPCPSHPTHRGHRRHLAPRQLPQASELRQQSVRHIERAQAPYSRAELYGEELGIGQGGGSFVVEPLARPLVRRPVPDLGGAVHTDEVWRARLLRQCPESDAVRHKGWTTPKWIFSRFASRIIRRASSRAAGPYTGFRGR